MITIAVPVPLPPPPKHETLLQLPAHGQRPPLDPLPQVLPANHGTEETGQRVRARVCGGQMLDLPPHEGCYSASQGVCVPWPCAGL